MHYVCGRKLSLSVRNDNVVVGVCIAIVVKSFSVRNVNVVPNINSPGVAATETQTMSFPVGDLQWATVSMVVNGATMRTAHTNSGH